LNEAFQLLSSQHPTLKFFSVHAENVTDVSEKYELQTVPYFIFFKGSSIVDKIDGANAPELRTKVSQYAAQAPSSAAVPVAAAKPAAAKAPAAPNTPELTARLNSLINSAPVMLFMKGTPEAAKCGFSRQMVELLKSADAKFSSFDILGDEIVRVGLREHSNWPTFPQLYVKGKLIGGLDIAKQMNEEGELAALLKKAMEQQPDAAAEQRKKIEALVQSHPIMVFMKGTAESPKCGFSASLVEILKKENAAFGSFDILTDESVRQNLKAYSNWPTYPQLFVKGKLIGGLDIVKELQENGELKQLLSTAIA